MGVAIDTLPDKLRIVINLTDQPRIHGLFAPGAPAGARAVAGTNGPPPALRPGGEGASKRAQPLQAGPPRRSLPASFPASRCAPR